MVTMAMSRSAASTRCSKLGLPVGRIYPLLEAKKIDDAEVTDAPHD